MFKGHQLIKLINEDWVFDLTEFVGYKVKHNSNGEVESYKEAFQALTIGEELVFEKRTRVPLKVLKEAANQIQEYLKEYGDDDEY